LGTRNLRAVIEWVVQRFRDSAKREIIRTTHCILQPPTTVPTTSLFFWHIDLTSVDGIDNVMWRPSVYCAAYGLSSA
jgi:hypothetical protein